MKPYQIVMVVSLVASGALALFGDNAPSGDIAEPVARAQGAARPAVADHGKDIAKPAILHLRPRNELVGEAGDAHFGEGEGVFLSQNWNPPPPKPSAVVSNAPPPSPVAPPLPFVFIGKAVAEGAWEVYLSRGDKTYVAKPHTVIDGAYRVERIAPPLMTLTYLPLNQVQQMNIGVLD